MSLPYARLADLAPLRAQLEAASGGKAKLALAKGKLAEGAKKPVDAGWLESPLTDEQAAAWDNEVAKGEGAFFFLLLRQCDPNLIVLDVDDPANPFAKDLLKRAENEGWWCAKSTSKGAHILFISDIGVKEVIPVGKAMTPLCAPRAGSRGCGEILTNAAVAYRPAEGRAKVLSFCDAEGLFSLLTGKPLSPKARLEGLLERTEAEIRAFPEGARHNSLFRLCATMCRRLKTIGAWDEMGAVAEKVAKWYREVNPEDKVDAVAVREMITTYDDGTTEGTLPENIKARLLLSVYEQIRDRHGGYIYIDGGASAGDLRQVHAWDMVATDWKVMTYIAQNETLDGKLNESFSDLIGRVVDTTYLDLTGEVPDLIRKHECCEAVWKEFRKRHSVAHMNMLFDNPDPQQEVNYFNVGDGRVLRVSARADDFGRGEAVKFILNEPQFMAARRLTTPADTEHEEFKKRIYEVWPEEGVADYMRMRWAEMLLPHSMHTPDFLSFYGEGGNGKSMIHDALLAAFGDFGVTSDISAIKKCNGEASPRTLGARASMVGARLVVIHEGGKDPMDEEVLKSIVAGNKIKVGGMYSHSYDAHILAKLCIMTNKPLRLEEVGAAMKRRACQVGCNQCYDDGEMQNVDRQMPHRLVKGAAGIIRMVINDVQRYLEKRHGANLAPLEKPQAVEEQTRTWLDSQDPYQAALKRFFKRTKDSAAPKMKQGRMSKEGTASGLAAVVDALSGDFYRCNPTREAKRFVQGARCVGRNPSDLYLVPTLEFANWCAEQDELTDTQRREVFMGVFRNWGHGEQVYGKMFDDAVNAAANPTPVAPVDDNIEAPKEEEIPW